MCQHEAAGSTRQHLAAYETPGRAEGGGENNERSERCTGEYMDMGMSVTDRAALKAHDSGVLVRDISGV